MDDRVVALLVGLADPAGRFQAAQALARHLGAEHLIVLVEDPAIDALVPAPGFPQTLPGGPAWRALLRRARQRGTHTTAIGYPTVEPVRPAVVYADAHLALVFVGIQHVTPEIENCCVLVPLFASALRAEHEAHVARGDLQVARDHARQAEALARALDAARSEVERTVRTLEKQSQALDEARARAEDAGRAKDEFLAMLGHELRNPLSPIVTALQLMRLKGQTSREQEVIERQVDSLMRLVDDLLDVSRVTRGKIELRKERVELADIAARAIEMSSRVLEKKRQVLVVDIPPRGFALDADPTRLAQVLANLLTNAAKYSDPDSRIIFAAEQGAGIVRIRVKDEGIGISADMLDRVFELFVQQRQSAARSQGGLGLGLAIVRSLVTLHGGTVHVHSEGEGKGSEFIVELPHLMVTDGGNPRQPAEAGAAGRGDRQSAPARVLVVDDNEDATILMSEALGSLGYEVRTATDGPTALRIAADFRPDVAVLDIGLPVMDGYELAQRLRAAHPDNGMGLVAVTGYGQGSDRRRSQEAGFDAHLVKPIVLEQLERVLEELRRNADRAGSRTR